MQRLPDLPTRGAPADEIREANRLARRATLDLMLPGSEASDVEVELQAIRIMVLNKLNRP
jgi:hypothetical protein